MRRGLFLIISSLCGCFQPVGDTDASVEVPVGNARCGDGGTVFYFPSSPPSAVLLPSTCEEVQGRLLVGCSPGSVQGLAQLRSVSGAFAIDYCDVADLSGLERLESVGALTLGSVWKLEHLRNLESLRTIGSGGLGILDAPELTSLEGLERITSAGITLSTLPKLESLHGLEGLAHADDLTISRTSIRSLSELRNLRVVAGTLSIDHNPQLPQREIDAFLAHVTVGGQTFIHDNAP